MTPIDARTRPLDPQARDALAVAGLRYELVPHEGERFDRFIEAVSRGFHDARPTPEQIEDSREAQSNRRLIGVFDVDTVRPAVPVATVDSWTSELTVDPGRTVPLWAISGVTVAPTHRRRGIARQMLQGELRAASDAGIPLAGLTVTEATIYGRWGFAPAAYASDWRIDTRRASWAGPVPAGRLDFVDQDDLPEMLHPLHERVRLQRPGQVPGWPGLWRRQAGLRPGADEARRVRAVAYRDEADLTRGILVYTLAEREVFGQSELAVRVLLAETDDAYAALWRFALEHDLVGTVTASLQPIDAPVRWMLSDQRAATVTVTDHHWLRVLDVPAAVGARHLSAPLACTVEVDDPLGFAHGTWRIETDEAGSASVERAGSAAPDIRITVGGLASILLGGVRADTLARAGIVRGAAAAVRALDAAFAPSVPPLLDIWY